MKLEKKILSQNINSWRIKKVILYLLFPFFLLSCKIIDKKYKCEDNVSLEKCLINYVLKNNLLNSDNPKYNSEESIFLHKINVNLNCNIFVAKHFGSHQSSIALVIFNNKVSYISDDNESKIRNQIKKYSNNELESAIDFVQSYLFIPKKW